jgi:hypothetical protein
MDPGEWYAIVLIIFHWNPNKTIDLKYRLTDS